jgi:heme-degrading monooxygenase HmoA
VFVFVSHLSVPEADHAALERHFRERSRLVDGFPGFMWLQLLKPQAGDATHTFVTAWESRAAFRSYMNSHEHAVSHAREPAEIMSRTRVTHQAFDVLLDSRLDPEWLQAGSDPLAPADTPSARTAESARGANAGSPPASRSR